MSVFLKPISGIIVRNDPLCKEINKITIKSASKINFLPGQYITVLIDGIIPRNYSIASIKSPTNFIDIYVNTKKEGIAVRTLKSIQIGDEIEFLEPVGEFRYDQTGENEIWFISTGSGISPFIPMISQAKIDKKYIKLFYGARTIEDIPDLSFLNIEIKISLSNPDTLWKGSTGHIYKAVLDELQKNSDVKNQHEYYICGIPQMVRDTNKALQAFSIKKDKIHYEEYGI